MRLLRTRSILRERSAELSSFIRYLEVADSEVVSLHRGSPLLPSPDVAAIMKSTALMMNYSLVEALVVELVDELFSLAESNNVPMARFSSSFRSQVVRFQLGGLREVGAQKLQEMVSDLIGVAVSNATVATPTKRAIRDRFLGNLDAKKVRELAGQFGIEVQASLRARNGADLLEIKTSRNQLAHGEISFVELGQLKSASDVRSLTARVVVFLISVVRSFERDIRDGCLFPLETSSVAP